MLEARKPDFHSGRYPNAFIYTVVDNPRGIVERPKVAEPGPMAHFRHCRSYCAGSSPWRTAYVAPRDGLLPSLIYVSTTRGAAARCADDTLKQLIQQHLCLPQVDALEAFSKGGLELRQPMPGCRCLALSLP